MVMRFSILRSSLPVIIVLATLLCTHAVAQVAVLPASPKAQETVRVVVPAGAIGFPAVNVHVGAATLNTYDPRATQVSMSNNTVTVSVQLVDNEFGSPSNAMDMPIGQLPAGDYQVEVVRRLPDGTSAGTVGTANFTVSTRTSADPLWNHTDLWWNATESGWGLSLTQHGSGIIFGAWFVYGSDGKATWYVIPTGTWVSPTEYHGPIYRTTGPYFGAATFDPSAVNVTLAGSAILAFDWYDSNKATVTLTVDGVTVTKNLRRQSF